MFAPVVSQSIFYSQNIQQQKVQYDIMYTQFSTLYLLFLLIRSWVYKNKLNQTHIDKEVHTVQHLLFFITTFDMLVSNEMLFGI